MREFFDKTYYGNTVQDWAISLAIILGSIIIGKILYWVCGNIIKKLTKKTKTKLDDILVDMLEEPIVFALIIAGLWYGLGRLDFSEGFNERIQNIFHILIAINVTWMFARVVDSLIVEYVVPLTEKTESDLDDQVLPIVRKGLRIIIWVMGIIIAMNNAGYDITALIAGLGIGGLALAMAAKDTVSNFFGGIMVFTDKPFKLGDRVRIDGFDGSITEIGMRSTRLQTLEGRIVTIPNSKFTENSIENVSMEPNRKVVLNIGLTYDTDHNGMQKGLELLKEIHARHLDIVEDDLKLSFDTFGDFSLGILCIYYIRKDADILETQTVMNMDILKSFTENGLEMAFPTQTVYHIKGD